MSQAFCGCFAVCQFTGARRYGLEIVPGGESPYKRATYRYTPLLALILTPNVYISALWGKLLFITCDVTCGYLIYKILELRLKNCKSVCLICACIWIYNPLPIAVSSRGNAESIVTLLVLLTLYCLLVRRTTIAAVFYAVSVHMKIYPVTYALPIYLLLSDGVYLRANNAENRLTAILLPNRTRFKFVFTAGITFVAFTGISYILYGEEFLNEAYLYHITRRDIRHNFSVYFYMFYLTAESSYSVVLSLVVFIPQLLLLVAISLMFYDDLSFCWFLHTIVFVTFNKVCTSQYFLWYLCLLPLILPSLSMTWKKAVNLLLMWFIGQGVWLCPAYFLEFKGMNTFMFIWLAGIMFFLINIWIISNLLQHYQHKSMFIDGKQMKISPCVLSRSISKLFQNID
ncbi:GPI alpha-1,4-mannosyltransferase I, catalytic subunit-like isoform X2 [Tubulanus polymorphus]|uniref:GPI alpha-1,4-mannosyltransferase I, catalytic subunit-like isoform X2 n=1 Tax=Tubulanus polymorphus TaxID=672921 RepID=UPI003DA51213